MPSFAIDNAAVDAQKRTFAVRAILRYENAKPRRKLSHHWRAIIGAALWALGDRTSAIVLLAAEALAWAALYALVGRER